MRKLELHLQDFYREKKMVVHQLKKKLKKVLIQKMNRTGVE